MDFGLPVGLAYRHNWAQEDQKQNNLYAFKKQAQIEAENRTKMLTDDLKFGKVNNAWGSARLRDTYSAMTKGLGKYVSENPDWQTNMEKRTEVMRLKNEFIDNPELNEGQRVDAHYVAMTKFTQDPKNGEFQGDPMVADQVAAYERYSRTGSASLDPAERKEFTFTAPTEMIDIAKVNKEVGGAIEHDIIDHNNDGSYTSYASDAQRFKAADGVLNSKNFQIL